MDANRDHHRARMKNPMFRARHNRQERMHRGQDSKHPNQIFLRKFVNPTYYQPWPEVFRAGGLWRLILEVLYGTTGEPRNLVYSRRETQKEQGVS